MSDLPHEQMEFDLSDLVKRQLWMLAPELQINVLVEVKGQIRAAYERGLEDAASTVKDHYGFTVGEKRIAVALIRALKQQKEDK